MKWSSMFSLWALSIPSIVCWSWELIKMTWEKGAGYFIATELIVILRAYWPLHSFFRDVNMTPASARTMKNACVLPCPLTQEPVLSKGSYWEAGDKASAVSSGTVFPMKLISHQKWVGFLWVWLSMILMLRDVGCFRND